MSKIYMLEKNDTSKAIEFSDTEIKAYYCSVRNGRFDKLLRHKLRIVQKVLSVTAFKQHIGVKLSRPREGYLYESVRNAACACLLRA